MSPILLKRMIDREKIKELISEKLDENMFLVDVGVSTNNVIHVEIDSFTGLTIDQCVAVSRHIESSLDRDLEDFELQVSSPGAGQPFKVKQQYRKNVGREVELILKNGSTRKGLLSGADDTMITLEYSAKEKQEGTSRKMVVTMQQTIDIDEIEKAKVLISFK